MTQSIDPPVQDDPVRILKEAFDRLRKLPKPLPEELGELRILAGQLVAYGDGDALYWLGDATLLGKNGVEQDVDEGLALLSRGAEAEKDAALATLANVLFEETGGIPAGRITLDQARAVELYKRVPETSPWFATCAAQLGRAYSEGTGISRNDVVATDYFRRAAELGQALAAMRYATRLQTGVGIPENRPMGHNWLETALKRLEKIYGDKGWATRVCRSRLGKSWLRGYGGQVNAALGLDLLRLAARDGDKEAIEELEHYRQATPDPDEEIAAAVGWAGPREVYRRIVHIAEQHLRFPQAGIAPHFILRGGEGTGRTRFTRLLASKLVELGYLQNGAVTILDMLTLRPGDEGRKQLEAGAGGLILIKDTRPAVPRAEDSQRQEQAVLQLIVSMLEKSEPRTLFALYADNQDGRIDRLLRLNDHFARFFKETVDFADYTAAELASLFQKLAKRAGFSVAPEADEALLGAISARMRRQDPLDRNAHLATRLLQDSASELARDFAETPEGVTGNAGVIDARVLGGRATKAQPISVDTLLAPLRGMVGLENVKREMEGLVSLLALQEQRRRFGLPPLPVNLHMVFQGPPGTGKTTVARMLGKVLQALGYLAKGHVVETDRSGLVAEYLGQTEAKTMEAINRADGGILFIDEAYALAKPGSVRDYGDEAIVTLVKAMEDRRDRFVVIAAGYDAEMQTFLGANSGLRSRFARVIDFPNYKPDEMLGIISALAIAQGYEFEPAALTLLRKLIRGLDAGELEAFANGRGLRTVLERSAIAQARRLAADPTRELDRAALTILTEADISMPDAPPHRVMPGASADEDGSGPRIFLN